MGKTLQVRVQTRKLKLSPVSQRALAQIRSYDWLFFTSKNTVGYFVRLLKEEKVRLPASLQIAAVGPVTAKALKKHGIKITKMPRRFTAEDMIKSLGTLRGKRILFPRSAIAPEKPVNDMQKRGAKVATIPLYTTLPVQLSKSEKERLLSGKFDAISFKSPLGIHSLLSQLTREQKRRVYAIPALAIGPMTAKKAREAGFRRVKDLSI